jgi:uncharacterized damage-inducible protein DinB
MRVADVRYLFDYDHWATDKVLAATARLPEAEWPAGEPIGERKLGEILVHALGAHGRWRNGLAETGETPRPEREPLPSVANLRAAWEHEWRALDAWLATIDDGWLEREDDRVRFWQMLAHVVNHGTQHRSEAAVLLTAAGYSPGDLDMIDFAEQRATSRQAMAPER